MLNKLKPVLFYLVPVALVGLIAQASLGADLRALNPFQSACGEPVTYAVREYDERFGISRQEFNEAVAEAAALWNEAAGRPVLMQSNEALVSVNLLYDERQQAIGLGETINGEQGAYEQMKAEVDRLSDRFVSQRTAYESKVATYERDARRYEEEVETWNARGGAPPAEYEQLEARKRDLERRKDALDEAVDALNMLAETIQARVKDLNALADETNQKVNTYNKTLGHDFDQGNYVEDEAGKRITIFTFEDRMELKRVLAHEFGHALGIGHVEDAGSIMYSYNIGDTLELSGTDISALLEVCEL